MPRYPRERVPRYPRERIPSVQLFLTVKLFSPADTVCAAVLDSEAVLVHESLPDPDDRLEDRLGLDHKSTKILCVSLLLSPSLTHSLPP